MEKDLKFNSQVCTNLKQSKKLLELGLKPETADCRHWAYTTDEKGKPIPKRNQKWFTRIGINESVQVCGFMRATFIPAWSLHRLLCMLDYDNADTFDIMPNIAYEDVIATISLRINCGAFNKKYLKQ